MTTTETISGPGLMLRLAALMIEDAPGLAEVIITVDRMPGAIGIRFHMVAATDQARVGDVDQLADAADLGPAQMTQHADGRLRYARCGERVGIKVTALCLLDATPESTS